jgi:beta-aspartyl-peptidase (threonine type)
MWRDGLAPDGLAEAETGHGEGEVAYRRQVIERLAALTPPSGPWGTTNVLALDSAGNLAAGVSTSGYPWKYPGRVGDSALIGAGNYCDNRVGAAACTGRGELAIRGACAHSAVWHLGTGAAPVEAALAALRETEDMPDGFRSALSMLAVAPDGRHAGGSTKPGATYSMMDERTRAPEVCERALLED